MESYVHRVIVQECFVSSNSNEQMSHSLTIHNVLFQSTFALFTPDPDAVEILSATFMLSLQVLICDTC